MKKIPLFILVWVAAFTVLIGSLNLYSASLYSDFNEAETTCINQQSESASSKIEECLVENILGINERELTPDQREVLVAHQAADSFNVILLLGSILSFILSGLVSWFYTFKRKANNA